MTLPDFEIIGRVVLTDDAGATVDKLKSSMSGATSAGNAMGSSVEDAGKKTEEAHGKFSKLGEATSNLGNAFQNVGQAIMGGFAPVMRESISRRLSTSFLQLGGSAAPGLLRARDFRAPLPAPRGRRPQSRPAMPHLSPL